MPTIWICWLGVLHSDRPFLSLHRDLHVQAQCLRRQASRAAKLPGDVFFRKCTTCSRLLSWRVIWAYLFPVQL